MPEPNQPQPPQNDAGNSGDAGKAGEGNPEESFWKKFDERIDQGIKRNIDNYRKNGPTGTSRSGRATLPGILADLVFGPAKSE